MIHSSVLQRIHRHTDDYAPTGIPQEYDVVYPQPNKYEEPTGNNSTLNVIRDVDADRPEIAVPFEETEADERAEIQQVLVDFLIWQRRVLYVVFIVGLLTLIATASIVAASPSDQFDIEDRGWGSVSRFVYFLAAPVVEIVLWAVPAYLAPGVVGLGRHPVLLVGFAGVALCIFLRSRSLKSAIVQKSNEAWVKGFGKPEYEPKNVWAHLKKVVRLLSTLILIKHANGFRQNQTTTGLRIGSSVRCCPGCCSRGWCAPFFSHFGTGSLHQLWIACIARKSPSNFRKRRRTCHSALTLSIRLPPLR